MEKYEFKKLSERGIPIWNKEEWNEIKEKYPKNTFREWMAEFIIETKPEFPYQKITRTDMEQSFFRLLGNRFEDNVFPAFAGEVVAKHNDYKYPFKDGDLVFRAFHQHNMVSNWFHQKARYKCGHDRFFSPIEIWNNYEKLKKLNYPFWRDGMVGENGISEVSWRMAFGLGSYIAMQFKPAVAKLVYRHFEAKVICDTSCGWGDRLAGFYTEHGTERYYGTDPNDEVYETYKKQCLEYERLLGFGIAPEIEDHGHYFECNGVKKVRIYNLPAEDVNWQEDGCKPFDLIFSSPPYFSTEKYGVGSAKEENQSWSRYQEYDAWEKDFFFPMLKKAFKNLKLGGSMLINIIDATIKGTRHRLCDRFVDHFIDHYDGQMGMEMNKRPRGTMSEEDYEKIKNSVMVENMWHFIKKGEFQ